MNGGTHGGAHEERGRDAALEARREAIETLIDEIGAQSFPASDPPVWGVVASRLEQAERDAGGPPSAGRSS